MQDIWNSIVDFYSKNQALTIALVSAAAGAIATKFIPGFFGLLIKAVEQLGKKRGGRLAYASAQKAYLNWVVLQNQDLNLTGIPGLGVKPKLEQVFISLQVQENSQREAPSEEVTAATSESRTSIPTAASNIINILHKLGPNPFTRLIHRMLAPLPPEWRHMAQEGALGPPLFTAGRFWRLRQWFSRVEVQIIGLTLLGLFFLVLIPVLGIFVYPDNTFLAVLGSLIWSLLFSSGTTISAVILLEKASSLADAIRSALLPLGGLLLGLFLEAALLWYLNTVALAQSVVIAPNLILYIALLITITRLVLSEVTLKPSSNEDDLDAASLGTLISKADQIAILGKPGSGKSTLTQFIALTFALEKAGDPKLRRRGISRLRFKTRAWYMPVLIPLRKIASHLTPTQATTGRNSIVEAFTQFVLPQSIATGLTSSYIYHMLDRKRCIFLLDGLDEVSNDEEFRLVTNEIRGLIARFPGNQVIITSRYAGWRGGLGVAFREYGISDLTDNQVYKFINSWYHAIEKNQVALVGPGDSHHQKQHRRMIAEQKIADLTKALDETPSIRSLAENPLLLSIICFVHYNQTLPKERLGLYNDCSRLLLDQWDREKGFPANDIPLSMEQKREIMYEIAFALHTGKLGEEHERKEAALQDILDIVERKLSKYKTPVDAQSLFDKLVARSGIIVLVEQYTHRYAFSHLTFQEFYTASYLNENRLDLFNVLAQLGEGSPEKLTTWWREVLLLYSAMQKDPSTILQRLQPHVEGDLLKQTLRVAIQCMSETHARIQNTDVEDKLYAAVLAVRSAHDYAAGESLSSPIRGYLARVALSDHLYDYALSGAVAQTVTDAEATALAKQLLPLLDSTNRVLVANSLNALSALSKRFDISETISRNGVPSLMRLLQGNDLNLAVIVVKLCITTGLVAKDKSLRDAAEQAVMNLYLQIDSPFYWSGEILTTRPSIWLSGGDHEAIEMSNILLSPENLEAARRATQVTVARYIRVGRYYRESMSQQLTRLFALLVNSNQKEYLKRQLLEGLQKGKSFQQVTCTGFLAVGWPDEEDVVSAITAKLHSEFPEVRKFSLIVLPCLNLNDTQRAHIRKQLSREQARSNTGSASKLIFGSREGKNDLRRLRATTLLLLDPNRDQTQIVSTLRMINSVTDFLRIFNALTPQMIHFFSSETLSTLFDCLERYMLRDYRDNSYEYLDLYNQLDLANTAAVIECGPDAKKSRLLKLLTASEAQFGYLQIFYELPLDYWNIQILAGNAEYSLLVNALEHKSVDIANWAFDLLLHKHLV
jgi:energy-coupling factor transporter ATP-binding protein EcfA2